MSVNRSIDPQHPAATHETNLLMTGSRNLSKSESSTRASVIFFALSKTTRKPPGFGSKLSNKLGADS